MFEAIASEPEEELEKLVFNCLSSPYAFELSLQFVKDINKRSPFLDTILHRICSCINCSVEQALKVIEMGADVNAQNLEGCTPLVRAVREGCIRFYRLLLEHGADVNVPDRDGLPALYSLCEEFYLEHVGVDENLFRKILKISPCGIDSILKAYPHYIEIFKEDLLDNLSRMNYLERCDLIHLLKPEDRLKFLKQAIVNKNSSYFHQIPYFEPVLRENSVELFHLALPNCNYNHQSGYDHHFQYSFLNDYKVDPNSVFDGTPCLFKANYARSINLLLEAGADPHVEVNGCKFFQMPNFVCPKGFADWMLTLHERGVDVFEPSPVTGKTIFEDSESVLHFNTASGIKMKDLTKIMLAELAKKYKDFNIHAIIDDDGNTLLHYHVMKKLKLSSYVFVEQFVLHENKAGETPLQLLSKSKTFFEDFFNVFLVESIGSLRLIEKAYDEFIGLGAFDAQVMDTLGASLFFRFLKNPCLSVAKYFLNEKKLAPEQLCSPLYCEDRWSFTDEWCEIDRVELFLNCGMHAIDAYRLYAADFCHVCPEIYEMVVERLGHDVERRFFEFCLGGRKFSSRETVMKIIKKKEIGELLQNNKKYALKLGTDFFNLCKTKEHLKTLLSIGLHPKDLIDYKIVCGGGYPAWTDPELWEILRDEAGRF